MFPELAFVKFSVVDSNNSHLISQRVMPLKCLRQGFRHVELRNANNVTLDISTLFVYSKQQWEHVQTSTTTISNVVASNTGLNTLLPNELIKPQMKHKHFKVVIYDDDDQDNAVTVKVTQDTTVAQVVEQVYK